MKRLLLPLLAALLAANAALVSAQTPPAPPAAAQQAAPQPAAPAPESLVDEGYVLGTGDMIEVSVLGQPEFTTRSRVRADGTIALPFIGDISAEGKTTLEFGDMVAAQLRSGGYYSKPIVTVDIASYASRYVIVLGAVGSPGLQPVDRAYRVSEIIARAGGIGPAGADYVLVTRENGEELKLPFERLARGGDSEDPVVNPGDKIYVPDAESFYIYGQIAAPGVYPLTDDMSVRKALARAGGLTPSGSESRVRVFRDGVRTKMELEDDVQPGDVIVIGERLF